MNKFLREILILFFFTILLGEIICRLFPIIPDIPLKIDKQGYYILRENQSGKYIRGKFPKWLNSNYHVNNIGFVSTKDYYFGTNDEFKIAIVGDSFVEGFQVDSDKSIGRLIEKKLSNYEVYEFGYSGYNIHNYIEIYEKFNLKNFKYVFFVVDINDVQVEKAEKTEFTKSLKIKELIFRKIYDYLFFFKYLNWNHSLLNKIINVFNLKTINTDEILLNFVDIEPFILKNNINLILKSKNDSILKNIYSNLTFLEIDHKLTPINFGYDQHWNLNGKQNVAETISTWISQQKK